MGMFNSIRLTVTLKSVNPEAEKSALRADEAGSLLFLPVFLGFVQYE